VSILSNKASLSIDNRIMFSMKEDTSPKKRIQILSTVYYYLD
jgi:hypothetical protein